MIKIVRQLNTRKDCTLGALSIPSKDFTCKTLELPWLDNQRSISCIPEGKYLAYKRNKSTGTVIELIGVPNRSYIQIHSGNYTRQIEGCILPGVAHIDIDGDGIPDVTSSKATLKKILSLVPNEFYVEITRG